MAGANGTGALLDVNSVRAALQAAHGRDKLDLLLSAPDPGGLVRAIPAQELYLTLLEVGPEEAGEVIALASPRQFEHFVDMACWPGRGDLGPDPKRVLHWLTLARETVGTSDARLARYREKLASLDAELLSLMLRKELTLYDLRENDDPVVQDAGSTFRTPDGHFVIEFNEGPANYAPLKQLLEDLYRQDVLGTTRMLEGIRWEVPTELEEIERRWRSGRLRDQGIPELEEALSFYARPAKKRPAANEPLPQAAQGETRALAAPPAGPPLLERAMLLLEGDERSRAEDGVVYAVNAAVVASGVALDDPFALRPVIEDARATLALGLTLLSGGDEARAAGVLAEIPARDIFQAAMAEAYRLQARARTVQKLARLPQAQSVTLLDSPLAELVDALAAQRPRIPVEKSRGKLRALASLADVASADAELDEAEATVLLLDKLGIGPSVLGPLADDANVGPSALRVGAVLRRLVESALRGEPFSLRDLPEEDSLKPDGFAQQLDRLLQKGTGLVHSEPAARAAARLKAQLS